MARLLTHNFFLSMNALSVHFHHRMKRLSDGIAMMVENALLKTGNQCSNNCENPPVKREIGADFHDFYQLVCS